MIGGSLSVCPAIFQQPHTPSWRGGSVLRCSCKTWQQHLVHDRKTKRELSKRASSVTHTAYSEHYGRELDVGQLWKLITGVEAMASPDPSTIVTSHPEMQNAAAGLECPSCFVKGASIVREGRNQKGKVVRQAHFRFIGPNGTSAHHPLCDFFSNEAVDAPRAGGVSFADERSAFTRAVRHLVCVGIERRVFDQADMRELRKWHFDMRCLHRFSITKPAAAVGWCLDIAGYRTWGDQLPFSPVFGDLPDYDWQKAARGALTVRHQSIIDAFTSQTRRGYWRAGDLAKSLMLRHAGEELFDAAPLEPYYEATIALADFAVSHWKPLTSTAREKTAIEVDPKAASLMAVCALLLSVSSWDVAVASRKLVELILAPKATDSTLGNFIGLNPFHDYAALRLIQLVQGVTEGHESSYDYKAELAAEVEAMKARCGKAG